METALSAAAAATAATAATAAAAAAAAAVADNLKLGVRVTATAPQLDRTAEAELRPLQLQMPYHWQATKRPDHRRRFIVDGENDRRGRPLADPELDVQTRNLRQGPSHRTVGGMDAIISGGDKRNRHQTLRVL
jgi:hypothetical protein